MHKGNFQFGRSDEPKLEQKRFDPRTEYWGLCKYFPEKNIQVFKVSDMNTLVDS